MQEGLRAEIQTLFLLAIALVIVGYLNGMVAETLILGGAGYTAYTLAKINRLYKWLASDKSTMPPEMSGVWGDISDELYRLNQRVEQAKKNYSGLALRIRQITSALDDGMILLDADLCLDWWNPSASALLDFKPPDKGKYITNLIRNPVFVDFIQRDTFDQPLEMRAPGDPVRIYHFMAGKFGRGEVILMVRDITRLRHLEEMRKEFVANISHELRTPLTVLMGYLETLQGSETPPPSWRRILDQMDQQTRRLNSLAEDLLMLSRLESTPRSTHTGTVDICNLLASIVENARVVSPDVHTISLDCSPGLTLAGGEHRELHSAFSNLIFNAIKHNPGGCHIDVRAREAGDQLVVEVADDGVGIDEKHLPRLTERFYRVDESRAATSGGTGLGLAIVKHVLARHNGSLQIRSTLSKGSTFSCVFEKAGESP